MKVAIAIVVVLAVACAGVWLWQRDGAELPPVPRDADVIAAFHARRADFETIRLALAKEQGALVIAPARERPAERFAPVVAAMRAIGSDLVTRGGDGSVAVTMYDAGQLTSGVTIDVVWRMTAPASADPRAHASVAIESGWYLERHVH